MAELTEKIILDTYSRPHVALSIGGCGILTEAMTWLDGYGGGHDENYMRSRSFALTFAHRVLCEIGLLLLMNGFQRHRSLLTQRLH